MPHTLSLDECALEFLSGSMINVGNVSLWLVKPGALN